VGSVSKKMQPATSILPCISTPPTRMPEKTFPIQSRAPRSNAFAAAHSLSSKPDCSTQTQYLLRSLPAIPWSDASHTRVFDSSVDGSVLVFVFPNFDVDSQLTPANAVEKIRAAVLDRFNRLKDLA